jgi:hypothetical protein
VNKTMLALVMVATIGLTTAAFADTASSTKHVQPAQPHASVITKKQVSHRIGAKKTAVAHNHNYRQGHYTSKKHVAKHVAGKKTAGTKASS